MAILVITGGYIEGFQEVDYWTKSSGACEIVAQFSLKGWAALGPDAGSNKEAEDRRWDRLGGGGVESLWIFECNIPNEVFMWYPLVMTNIAMENHHF